MTDLSALIIDWIGGNCPVQAEGTVDGLPFYFRARGDSWSMSIGGENVICLPDWCYEEDYGDGPYDAGWMPEDVALGFIRKSTELYLSRDDGTDDGQPTEQQERQDYDRDC